MATYGLGIDQLTTPGLSVKRSFKILVPVMHDLFTILNIIYVSFISYFIASYPCSNSF